MPTQYCPSKNYSSEDQNEILNIIRGFVGRKALNSVIVRHDSVVGSLSKISRTVFEINRKDFNLAKDDFSRPLKN